ncbi:uncharacterized protein LOC122049148 [Zingiber officinale]|uniref:uncharacterized protein LOC122049148 n=1 Tax=Zingiber officinale TaxID=94328 RepID=UPI001C4C6A79|nr:uncharacterized protein LOC122049148 [Zingiber officinale]
MEMAVSISSLGLRTRLRRSLPTTALSRRRKRMDLSQRCKRRRVETWPSRKRKNRMETARAEQELGRRPAAKKGSLRAKGQNREASSWQLPCPPPRSLNLPMISRWTPMANDGGDDEEEEEDKEEE